MDYQKNLKLYLIYFSFFFILGFLIYDDYGISWDEPISRTNGLFALKYIYSLLDIDFTYKIQSVYSTSKETFKEYNDNFYGVIFDLPMAILEFLFNIKDTKKYYLIRHLFNYFIFIIGSFYFFLTLRSYFNLQLSIIGILFLIFTPRIFAESFYNNKDLVFLSLFCISNYYGLKFFEKENIENLFKFSLISGLSCGTRLVGLIIPCLILFFSIIKYDEKNILHLIKNKIIYIMFIFFFIYIFYPYIWENPSLIFESLSKFTNFDWAGSVFYFGRFEIAKYMPWHYIPIMILITIPLVIVIFFFIGLTNIFKFSFHNFFNLNENNSLIWKNKLQYYLLFNTILILSTLFIIIEKKSTVYGGWRQFYFLYPSIIFIAVYGINIIVKLLHSKSYFIIKIIIYLSILNQVFWIYSNHPYQYVFYNSLAKNIFENFELDYWGVSNRDLLMNLDRIKYENEYKIYIYSVSPYQNSLLLMNDNEKKKYKFVKKIENAKYIVSNHYYQDSNPKIEYEYLNNNFNKLFEIKVNNSPINTIYEK
jgi:hypothetical protein